jgi:hypothetical protein
MGDFFEFSMNIELFTLFKMIGNFKALSLKKFEESFQENFEKAFRKLSTHLILKHLFVLFSLEKLLCFKSF